MSDAFGVMGAGLDLCSMLRARAKALVLAANTLAGTQVQTSRNSPLTDEQPFFVAIYTPEINRTWAGEAPVSFTAKVTLVVVGKATGKVLTEAEARTDMLRVQLENALLASVGFWTTPVERVNSVNTTLEFPSEGEVHTGYVTMKMECQCTDYFVPDDGVPLTMIGLTIPNPTMPAGSLPEDNLIGATISLTGA